MKKSPKIIDVCYAGNQLQAMNTNESFCKCAVDFYELRGSDVKDELFVNLLQRLDDDGCWTEFFEMRSYRSGNFLAREAIETLCSMVACGIV